MRLASFDRDGRAAYGIVLEDCVIDLAATLRPTYQDLRQLLAALSPELLDRIRRIDAPRVDLQEVAWRPVIPNPDKIFCVGLNYRDHVNETGRAPAAHPVLFLRVAASQVGHRQALIRPSVSEQLDFEGELAVIIGKPGRHIKQSRALVHVAGYSIYNEASIRDWQRHTHQYTAGKNFSGTGAFGPWLVTADDIPDPAQLALTTRLNGAVMQHASLSKLLFSIPQLIAYISTITELACGDVIVTGTPSGVGGLRSPPVWMKPGDVVEVEIRGIGILSNPIEAEPA